MYASLSAAGHLCRRGLLVLCVVSSFASAVAPLCAQEKLAPSDLASLTVDDLMNVEVTSVSRKGQKLSDTAAAVFVITQDDIRRSGATSIPDLLRMVPGLDVDRINGNTWAISARGTNGRFANKLLVMVDGRTVYTPLFSGVNWDVQDTLLEDIDRIEVIRGPGGTLWGANAVNGIINIITKHTIDTQGTLVSVGTGSANDTFAAARAGGSVGRNGYYRVYGKSFDRPESMDGSDPSRDASAVARGGFRADWTSSRGDNFTAQGDVYRGSEGTVGLFEPGNPFADRAILSHLAGQDLQFRWNATQSSRSDTTLQAFYDYSARSLAPSLALNQRTFDLDFQQHLKLSRNDVVWGAEYRTTHDHVAGTGLALIRDSNVRTIAGLFVQDEMTIAPRLRLTAGTKVEDGPKSDLQLQPTLRLLFKASQRQTLWVAATSAVRTPSEIELYASTVVDAIRDSSGHSELVTLTGNPDLIPERVDTYELGYRWQATPDIAFDATVFHNHMRNLVQTAASQPFVDSSGQEIIPVSFDNTVRGQSNGAELLVTEAMSPNWNLALSYSLFQMTAIDDTGVHVGPEIGSVTTPRHQVQLRSFLQLPRQVELDSSVYYVGRVGSEVEAYVRLDAQISWHPAKAWEFSISGQNLLKHEHTEFVGNYGEIELSAPVQRTVNGKITWRF